MSEHDERTPLTEERAARRYRQAMSIERHLALKQHELAETKRLLKDIQDDYDDLLRQLRKAARDEGELPLFVDLSE